MKSLAIERHNAAGRIIAQAIRHGALGNCVMMGDVGMQGNVVDSIYIALGSLNGSYQMMICQELTQIEQ